VNGIRFRRVVPALMLAGSLTAAMAAQHVNVDRAQLAVKGYDVVAYFVEGRPEPGSAAFEYTHGGVRYRFASAANRDRFREAPERYLPQYGGFCAYAVSRGYTADTDPLAWKIVDGRLFLNYDRGAQRKWEEDVAGNIRKGDANWPSLQRER
jgi:YHS domain-containing protein